jgi:hypothetical protein
MAKADLTFSSAHKAYADAVMLHEAHKLFNKQGPSPKAAEKASFNWTLQQDKLARAGSPADWHNATARDVNGAIQSAARKEIRKAGKTLVKDGKLINFETDGLAAPAPVAAMAALMAAARGNNTEALDLPELSLPEVNLSRRQLFAVGAGVATLAYFGSTQSAFAVNDAYVSTVSRDVQSYARAKARATVEIVGSLGIRG